ncbi:hypothetical protein Pan44_07610 [Caulifigura coniformis]|uniref:Uncharacterized protein n=1 Tax=Caulifigura coniformis TaxID=2527983 RepID=A0A517S9E1_9PLAN|nr:hypothetical protein [Caulifigura coniformis]QDT52749.1 hypothetical protein Pan44_07610 [Caulifigura coniformis]
MSLRAFTTLSAVVLALGTASLLPAQNFPGKPANPGRQEMSNSYRSRGSFSNGYRPSMTYSYQQSARSHAQALSSQGQTVKQLDPQTAREHVAEVKKNVESSKKELAKIDQTAAKNAEIVQHIDAMKKHYEAAEKCCVDAEKHITDDPKEAELASCCADMDKHLAAAEAEHKKLMELLHIELPKPAAK